MGPNAHTKLLLSNTSEIWGINPHTLEQHQASVLARAQQLQVIQEVSGSASKPSWGSIDDPLELVSFANNNKDAHINVYGVVLAGASQIRWLISEGYYNDPNLISKAVTILNSNPLVERIILHVDTPGGNISGCYNVGQTLANSPKSIVSEIEDMCASAGFWYISSSDMIIADEMSQVGSIGTLMQLIDSSKFYEKLGLTPVVISTGPLKGAFSEGKPITDVEKEYAQKLVNNINQVFLNFISKHRPNINLESVTSGAVWLGEEAKALGLIDSLRSYEKTPESQVASSGQPQSENKETLSMTEEEIAKLVEENKRLAAQVSEITSAARANKYLSEAKEFGNVPGFEHSQVAAILAASDDAKIGEDIRTLIKSCVTLASSSEALKMVGVKEEAPESKVEVNSGDPTYDKLHARAIHIQKTENVSYGIAFLKATKEGK